MFMAGNVDPRKAKLYPEVLPEAIVATASSSGTSIASYSAFSPYVMQVKSLYTGATPDVTLRIDVDSGHAVIESPLTARPDRESVEIDVLSRDSLDLWAVGSSYTTYVAYTLRITKPTVFEKIKYGLPLTSDEESLADQFDIRRKYSAGILRSLDVPQFKKIIEVAKELTVSAGNTTRIGRMINVRRGEKAVLLGIAVDRDAVLSVNGGPGANDTYITVNRDIIDTDYIKLDCAAMPSIDKELPCYIPATDRLEVNLYSASGITSLPVRYRYGIASLSILEKIRWDIALTKDEANIATELGLYDSVLSGVL